MSQKKAGLLLVLAVSLCSLALADKFVFAKEKERNGCNQREFGRFSDWSEPVNLGLVVKSEYPADTIVSYCGGDWGVVGGDTECSFPCFAGDHLEVFGHCSNPFGSCGVTVTATCGGVTVKCDNFGEGGRCITNVDTAVAYDDPNGSCVVDGFPWGWYYCLDVTPDPPPAAAPLGGPHKSPSHGKGYEQARSR